MGHVYTMESIHTLGISWTYRHAADGKESRPNRLCKYEKDDSTV